MKYRKRPIVVEAEQFLVEKELPFRDRGPVVCFDGERWYVETAHGQKAFLEHGDWVIMEGSFGTQAYPCKPEIFQAIYEKVEE